MTTPSRPVNPARVACDICLKEIPRSEAVVPELGDYVVFFCGLECFDRWKTAAPERAGLAAAPVQLGRGRGAGKDEAEKQLVRRHPQRDEPLIDSVEPDETPAP